MKQVPVVSVSTAIIRNADARVVDQRQPAGDLGLALEEDRDAERLHDAQHDRPVARMLRDLAAAELAFLRQLLEVRPHHRQQLQDDRRADVGHDAQREDRHLRRGCRPMNMSYRPNMLFCRSAARARRARPRSTPGTVMWCADAIHRRACASVNSTRLRSSETAKMFFRLSFTRVAPSRRPPPRSSPRPCR